MHRSGLPTLFASIWLLAVTPALAQNVPSGTAPASVGARSQGLETIVVTARKRTESLQNVPVSVSPISALQIQNNNATDLMKLAELAPQVMIGQTTSGVGAVLTIRGISTSPTNSGLEQSVSVAIDGVQLSRGRVIAAALYDIQQVEILEGPQALFFGKNSPAGVISIHTKDPTDRIEGFARVGYEFVSDENVVQAAVSGPIADFLKARLAFHGAYMRGWMRNIATPLADPFNPGVINPGATAGTRQPETHDYSGRLTLVATPWDDFEAKLKLTWNRKRLNGWATNAEPFCIGGQVVPLAGTRVMPNTDCQKNMVRNISALPAVFAVNHPFANGGKPHQSSKFFLGSLALDKKFTNVTVNSTTGYYTQTNIGGDNNDWSPFARIFGTEWEDYELVTQELRANTDFDLPVNFTAGAYYEHSKRHWINSPIVNPGPATFNPNSNSYASRIFDGVTDSDSYSVFGQARWNIVPTVELAGGLRYSHDEKDARYVNLANNPAFGGRAQGVPLLIHFSDNNVSPEVTLSWHPEPDQTLYAAYKTGYKSGTISNKATLDVADTPQSLLLGRESVKGFEVGYKGDLFDRRLRLDVTAYRYNYNGLQVSAFNPQTLTFRVSNAAGSRTTGVTASAKWIVTDSLSFNGNLGYNRARYTRFTGAQCYLGQTAATGCVAGSQNLSGKALVRAPDVTFALGANYTFTPVNGWAADLSVDGAYTSSYQTQEDYAPGGLQSAYWRLNAALHVGPDNGRFDFAVIGRNLTNSYYRIATIGWSGSGQPNQYTGYFNRPREVMIQAEYRF